jgi:hypothetical protein
VAISEGRPRVAGQFADDITIMDLDIQTGIFHQGAGSRHLYYRNDIVSDSTNVRIDFSGALAWYVSNSGLPTSSFYETREFFIVDNRIYGVSTSSGPSNLVQGSASRLAFMGNDLGRVKEHNVRLWSAHKAFIGHNALRGQSFDGNRHSLKLHAFGLTDYADTRDINLGSWATTQVVIANNLFGDRSDNNYWTAGISPQNNVEAEGLQDVILENNRFVRGPNTNTEAVMVGRRMTSRGNVRIDGGIPNINSATHVRWSIPVDWNGPYYFSP